jgi:hypothetical protein
MNCEEFARSLPDRLELLGEDQQRHAAVCRNCSAIAGDRLRLAEGFRTLARDWNRLAAPARVEARLLAVFRGHAGIPIRQSGRGWLPAVTWASAAAVVIALALFLVRDRQPQVRPVRHSTRSAVQMAAFQAPDWADPETAAADGFIALPNAEQITADEEVNLVRVELPRSSMVALGYPVSADLASDSVEADVVLGADGLARAVRFVDE